MKDDYSFADVYVWRDAEKRWHFDGPAGCGPRIVRTSGRGPYWRGPVTRQFVVALLRAARKAGYEVREGGSNG